MTVTAKLRLYPDDADAKLLIKTMHAYKNACNEISAYIFDKKQLSKKKVREDFYRDIRQKYSLGAQMAQSVIDSVIAKYKAENTKGPGMKCDSKSRRPILCTTGIIPLSKVISFLY